MQGVHTALTGRESLCRTLTQGFTLGYFRLLPPGGTAKVTPSEGGDPGVDTPPPIAV
jgi:hypothetical protein